LIGCGNGSDDGSPPPPSSGPTGFTSAATASPSVAPEVVPVIAGPCCLGFELDPGRYASPSWFEVPFTLEVGEGLSGWENLNERGLAIGRGENDVSHLNEYVSFFAVDADSPILQQLDESPDLSSGSIEPITIAGIDGSSLEAQARPVDGRDHPEIQPGTIRVRPIDGLVPGFWYSESAEARFHFVLLPIGEAALFVSIEAPPNRADAFFDEAIAMLGTAEFA
jgi:hypothetical protein